MIHIVIKVLKAEKIIVFFLLIFEIIYLGEGFTATKETHKKYFYL